MDNEADTIKSIANRQIRTTHDRRTLSIGVAFNI